MVRPQLITFTTSLPEQGTRNKEQYNYICRTDIKGYYANINKSLLLQQIRQYVSDPLVLDLLAQFLYYTVEDGGNFHTPNKGITRGASLSPLLAAFHLFIIDDHFANIPHLYYARYMDDFIILTATKWQLKRAVAALNHLFNFFGFKQHPDKTFIGHITKGFDWMGFWFTEQGCTQVAPRAHCNHIIKLNRLYEQVRKLPAKQQAIRMMSYLTRWERWKNNILTSCYFNEITIGNDAVQVLG